MVPALVQKDEVFKAVVARSSAERGVVKILTCALYCDKCCCQVPELWASSAYPSMKTLGSWIKDLVFRVHFVDVSHHIAIEDLHVRHGV